MNEWINRIIQYQPTQSIGDPCLSGFLCVFRSDFLTIQLTVDIFINNGPLVWAVGCTNLEHTHWPRAHMPRTEPSKTCLQQETFSRLHCVSAASGSPIWLFVKSLCSVTTATTRSRLLLSPLGVLTSEHNSALFHFIFCSFHLPVSWLLWSSVGGECQCRGLCPVDTAKLGAPLIRHLCGYSMSRGGWDRALCTCSAIWEARTTQQFISILFSTVQWSRKANQFFKHASVNLSVLKVSQVYMLSDGGTCFNCQRKKSKTVHLGARQITFYNLDFGSSW